MGRAGELMGQGFWGSRVSGAAGSLGEQGFLENRVSGEPGFLEAGFLEHFVFILRKGYHQALFPPPYP